MTIQHYAILISLALTVPLVGVSICVLDEWGPSLIHEPRRRFTATDWLVLGICLSFLGSIGDNLWWGVAWATKYLNQPNAEWWFENGVFSNVCFRQGLKLLAGYCHLRAAVETGAMSLQRLHSTVFVLVAIAVVMVIWLVML